MVMRRRCSGTALAVLTQLASVQRCKQASRGVVGATVSETLADNDGDATAVQPVQRNATLLLQRQADSRRADADAILTECCVLRHTRLEGRSSRGAIGAALLDLFIW